MEGKLSVTEASEILGLSERQIKRLRKGVSEAGKIAVTHGNTGRPPSTKIKDEQKEKITRLYKEKYYGANYQHFIELLRENEGINISDNTARTILNAEGIKSPRTKRKPKKHKRRNRRSHEGELVQTDATPHDFLGLGEPQCLHGIIDDATGKIYGLHMTKNECLEGYFAVFEHMVINFGVPASVYADRHTIIASPKTDKLTVEDELAGKQVNDTQLGRALKELNITLILARSAQAKGKIERLWSTLQDRLTLEFRVKNITAINAANEFLRGYINDYNNRFAVDAAEPLSMLVPNVLDLARILCVKEKRKVDKGGAFSYKNKLFVVNGPVPSGACVEVVALRKFGVFALYNEQRYDAVLIEKPTQSKTKPTDENKLRKPNVPPEYHYYKRGKDSYVRYSSEYNDAEILAVLDDIFFKNLKG